MPPYDGIRRTAQLGALPHQWNSGALRHLGGIIGSWLDRSRQCKALADLDDRLLRDIGITRSEAKREAAKPFWYGGKA